MIINGWKPSTIITKHFILDVAAVPDPPLFISNTKLSIPSLTPQSAILGHIDLSGDYLLIGHLTLICK